MFRTNIHQRRMPHRPLPERIARAWIKISMANLSHNSQSLVWLEMQGALSQRETGW